MSVKEELSRSVEGRLLVKIRRDEIEDGSVSGYVISLGPEFFVLEVVDPGYGINGFNCLRYRDVTECEVPAPTWRFLERSLELRGIQRNPSPQVDPSSLPALLRTAGASFPVITIHPEEANPDVCYIGRFAGLEANMLQLLEISPDAEWGEEEEEHCIDEITRIDFGCAYEEALVLVASAG